MGALDVSEVSICPWALREGIMLHYLQSTLDDTWALPLQPLEPGAPEPADAANVHPLPRRGVETRS
jgi:exopolyphosphatase/guanosine-5'-triphosphate,3'-diphosphate pyrophosphatase